LPKSIILHTGGFAFGDISTKSKSTSSALFKASGTVTIPICSLSCPISLTLSA